MDGNLNNLALCCFCGDSVAVSEAIVLTVALNMNSEESQTFFAHKQHFVEALNKNIPLDPDFFEDL